MCIQQLFGGLRSIFYTPTLISINDIMAWGQGQPPQARLQALLQAPLPELLRYLSGQVLGQARPAAGAASGVTGAPILRSKLVMSACRSGDCWCQQ